MSADRAAHARASDGRRAARRQRPAEQSAAQVRGRDDGRGGWRIRAVRAARRAACHDHADVPLDLRYRSQRGRGSDFRRYATSMSDSARDGRHVESRRRRRLRLFHHARRVGAGGVESVVGDRDEGVYDAWVGGAVASVEHDRGALLSAGERADRREVDSGDRRGARRDGQHRVHRSLPAGRARPLHRAPARTPVRYRRSANRVSGDRPFARRMNVARLARHARDETRGEIERAARFRNERRPELPHVRHLPPDLEVDIDARCARLVRDAARIVQQDFCAAHLHEERRQTLQVCVERRCVRMGSRRVAEIQPRGPRDGRTVKHRIDAVVGLQRRARRREIGPRRKQDRACRQRLTRIAQRDERREREAAARRIACDHDRVGLRAVFEQATVRGQYIVERGGKRVFGREPVIERERARAAARCESKGRRAMRLRRAEIIPAAMQIEDRRRVPAVDARQPFAAQRPVVLAIALIQRPARRHTRRVRALRRHPARAFGADRRMPRLRMKLTAQEPACQGALPTHRGTLHRGLNRHGTWLSTRFNRRRLLLATWTGARRLKRKMAGTAADGSGHRVRLRASFNSPATPGREFHPSDSARCER
ncbi:LuxR family transcriptional regulator [Paraburkholderia hospita]|uniref:LuxR family transcriptional regulator n=1 Tax=Paraburkholderia hospita TaxID=169430 RepID=A0ABN0FRQ3_9BURK|nr:LuxR family transcriptional regulator [Paraburkholderia hospita]